MDVKWLWQGWLTLGMLGFVTYTVLPAEGWYRVAVYDILAVGSVAVIVTGIRLHRPAHPTMWYLFAVAYGMYAVGDIAYQYLTHVVGRITFPAVSDLCYVGASPLIAGGIVLMIRHRARGRDFAGVLDALIIGTGFGLFAWSYAIHPILTDGAVAPLNRAVLLSYPLAAILTLAMLAWLATTVNYRTVSFRLVSGALLLVFVANIVFSVGQANGESPGEPITTGWLLSYVVWSAAAAHPSMRALSEPTDGPDTTFSPRRIVTVGAFVLLAPGMLVVQGLHDARNIDWLPISVASVVLCLLVLARTAGLVRHIRAQSSSLVSQALHDELTGLPNRRLLEQGIDEAVRAGRPVQVALVDLDDFKAVNDRLGHVAGDELLIEAAHRLRSVLRSGDMVARLGGDEFALLMHDATETDADRIVTRVLERLEAPVTVGGGEHQLLIQASIGLTDGAGTTDPHEVVRRADIAMYAAKTTGGRRQRYELELDHRAVQHSQLGAELRSALDAGGFRLVYQPIVALPEGRLAGVEALIRWIRPGEPVGPDRFIPVAERTGLIVPMGRWVLEEACRQLAEWDRRFGPLAPARLSVNVSARQLTEPGFAEWVAVTLTRFGLLANRLTVEVTETAVFNGGRAVEELDALHELGVRVALDDFGTGHSSLGLLQTCPVDVLKVDKSFVDGVTLETSRSVIASALISISQGLRLSAIAEGVETAEQAGLLFELGYRFAQGYHFARPLTADDLAEWIRSQPGTLPATTAPVTAATPTW